MAKRLLVIGAGTGGLMVANQVARRMAGEIRRGAVSVTLLGDRDAYFYQPGLLYVPFDLMRPDELTRKVNTLLAPGVQFIHDQALRIDPDQRTVSTGRGQTLGYDYLVVATGSEVNPAEIPGLAEGGHWFYTLDGALKLKSALRSFTGGRLVMTVGLPHKCPVAPLEFVFMFEEWARQRGIRDQTEIVYTFPLGRAHSIESVAAWAAGEFERRGIVLETFFNMETVDVAKQEVNSLEGTSLTYDLLVAIPPHIGAEVGWNSGLAETGNWLTTNRSTLTVGNQDRIFAVGDATNLPVSKAGSVAHFEAEVVTGNLVRLLSGEEAGHLYTGRAYCFIEAGLDQATYIAFDYQNPPVMKPPSQSLHWFKQTYNRIHWLNLKGIA